MARRCEICGKSTESGNNVSHSHNKTRRKWKPNIIRVKTLIGSTRRTIKVCARCLRSNKVVKI